MRILQITSTFYPVMGGQEKVVYELSKRLKKRGHEVMILTSDFMLKENSKRDLKIDGLNVLRLKNNFKLGGYGYSLELKKWLDKNIESFDIVHVHGYNRYFSEFAIKYIKGRRPVIFTPHGFAHTKKNYVFKKVHDIMIGNIIRKANLCTALTEIDYGFYDKLGVDKKKIILLPNGVDLKKYKNKKLIDISNFKKKYRLDKPTVLYVGRIHKSKGLNYLIEAISELNANLLIVGGDYGYKTNLLQKIKNLNIKNKIIFLENINDNELVTAYQSSDVFVLFSEWEGFGIVVLEAMAAGTPVVVSDRGSLPTLVKNNNGYIARYGDVEDLKKGIRRALKKDRKVIANAKKTSQRYDWESIVNKLDKIYRDLK